MSKLLSCMKCDTTKPVSAFYPYAIRKRGNRGECKPCIRSRVRVSHEQPHRLAYHASEEGKQEAIDKFNRYCAKYPDRRQVRQKVTNAIRSGKLIRPSICECCNASGEIQAHHDDYNKPLSVRWLCDHCHDDWHNNNTPIYQNH